MPDDNVYNGDIGLISRIVLKPNKDQDVNFIQKVMLSKIFIANMSFFFCCENGIFNVKSIYLIMLINRSNFKAKIIE